jgi:hypothetical protein
MGSINRKITLQDSFGIKAISYLKNDQIKRFGAMAQVAACLLS